LIVDVETKYILNAILYLDKDETRSPLQSFLTGLP